jgi:hypothetical protein
VIPLTSPTQFAPAGLGPFIREAVATYNSLFDATGAELMASMLSRGGAVIKIVYISTERAQRHILS